MTSERADKLARQTARAVLAGGPYTVEETAKRIEGHVRLLLMREKFNLTIEAENRQAPPPLLEGQLALPMEGE